MTVPQYEDRGFDLTSYSSMFHIQKHNISTLRKKIVLLLEVLKYILDTCHKKLNSVVNTVGTLESQLYVHFVDRTIFVV